MKIYVPNYTSSQCAVIQNNSTLRVYDTKPSYQGNFNYTDYYYNSHYYYTNGTQYFNYNNYPTCIASSNISTDYWYRNDFVDICTIIFVFFVICFCVPFSLFKRFMRRF